MRNIILILTSVLIISCVKSKEEIEKENSINDLILSVDFFVNNLNTTVGNYSIFESEEKAIITKDKKYRIAPVGRLINVKLIEYSNDSVYESLNHFLNNHYSKDDRVNKVYINAGGTIMVDCRY